MKAINLKADKNIFKNTNTLSKTYEFGIKQEGLDNDKFIKNIIETFINKKDDFIYHYHIVGIDTTFLIKELEYLLNDSISEFLKEIKSKDGYGKHMLAFEEGINKNREIIKKNVIGIFKNIIFTKTYFSYSTPKLKGNKNNPNVASMYNANTIQYINKLKDAKIEDIFIKNKDYCYIKEGMPEIYPSEISISEKSKNITVIPEEYISKENIDKNRKVVYGIYDYFLDNIVSSLVAEVQNELFNKNVDTTDPQEMESRGKNILLNVFSSYTKKIADFSFKTFYNKGFLNFNETYLYEDTLSKVVDLVYVGKQDGSNFISKMDLDYLKKLLIEGIRLGFYNNFTLKLNLDFTGKRIKVENRGNTELVTTSRGSIATKLEEIENVEEIVKKYGKKGLEEMKVGITIGLFGNSIKEINNGLKWLITEHYNEGINISFLENCNYENNNRLFSGSTMADTYMHTTFASNIKEVLRTTSYADKELNFNGIYMGTDVISNFPLFKDPFEKDDNKNMLIIGKSGSGKTFFSMQQILTSFRDKFIIIDPTSSYAKLRFIIKDGIFVKKISELEYNPLWIDEELYNKYNLNINEAISSNIKLLMEILTRTEGQKYFNADTTYKFLENLLNYYYKEENGKITLKKIKEKLDKAVNDGGIKVKVLKTFGTARQKENDEDIKEFDDIIVGLNQDINKLLLGLNGILENPLYSLFNTEKSFDKIFLENNKIIFDTSELNKTGAEDGTMGIDERIIFLYLMSSIQNYLAFNSGLINKYSFKASPKHWLIVDEVHKLINDKTLLPQFINLVRIVRNYKAQITGLTQNTTDLVLSGKGKELELLGNFSIKVIFKDEDIGSYIQLLSSSTGNESNIKDKRIDKIQYYKNVHYEYDRKVKEAGEKAKVFLLEYFGEIYVCKSLISDFFVENYSKIKSG